MLKTNWYFLLLIFVIGSGCKNDDFDISSGCVKLAQANSELFNDAPASTLTINNVQLDGNCIFIEFRFNCEYYTHDAFCTGRTYNYSVVA